MKKADIYLGLGVILIGCILFLWISFSGQKGNQVEVSVNGQSFGIYPLDQNRVVDIQQENHGNKLEIKNGKAQMIFADCPDQYCVKHKNIGATNETIVCLPNKVMVTVISGEEGQLDAITN